MAYEDDVVARLVSAGVGRLNVNLFVSSKAVIPPGPGPYLTLVVTGGTSPERTQNAVATPAYQRPSLQVSVRASTYPAALAMARAAYNALVGIRNLVLNGVFYREVNPMQEPFDLGLDSQGRPTIAFNVSAIKRP